MVTERKVSPGEREAESPDRLDWVPTKNQFNHRRLSPMKVCNMFSQVLKLFARGGFEKAVKQHQAERHGRGFTSWGQFIAMLFSQVGRAHPLCEHCGALARCEGHVKD